MTTDPTDPLQRTSPIPSTPGYGGDTGPVGDKPDDVPKDFNLPTKGGKQGPEGLGKTGAPSPMEVAQQSTGAQRLTPEQLSEHLDGLRNNLNQIQSQLQDKNITDKFTQDHISAMKQVVKKMNPDMRTIANETGGKFQTQELSENHSGGILGAITHWVNGSQEALSGALNYMSKDHGQNVNPASYLKLQYSVQRASQRGELFASIISASVSGIKTIMSTQLG